MTRRVLGPQAPPLYVMPSEVAPRTCQPKTRNVRWSIFQEFLKRLGRDGDSFGLAWERPSPLG